MAAGFQVLLKGQLCILLSDVSRSQATAPSLSGVTAMQGQRDIRADCGSGAGERQGVLAHRQRREPAPCDCHQGGQACDR